MHSSASNRRSSKALSTFVTILLLVCTVFWGWTKELQMEENFSLAIHANSYDSPLLETQNATIVATSNSKSNDLSFVVLSSKSPHSNVADSGDEEQFLLYYTHSGFSNQIFAFQRAAQLAWTVNRTLVLPPLLPHREEDRSIPFDAFPGRKRPPGKCGHLPRQYHKMVQGIQKDAHAVLDGKAFPSFSEFMNLQKLQQQVPGLKVMDFPHFLAHIHQAKSSLAQERTGNYDEWCFGQYRSGYRWPLLHPPDKTL